MLALALLSEFLQVELDVVDVGELHQEAASAAAAVLEVDLLQALVGDVAQLLLAGPRLLGVKETAGELRREGHGEVAQAAVIGGAGRCGVAEPGAGVDDDPAGGGSGLLGLGADLRLPPLLDLVLYAVAPARGAAS